MSHNPGSKRVPGRLLICIALSGCCCTRTADFGPAHSAPLPDQLILAVPPVIAASADTITEVAMQNVDFHVDDEVRLRVRHLRGRMSDMAGEHIIVLDDKRRLLLDIAWAEIALTSRDLTLVMNRYVFGYAGSPLKNLVVHTSGRHIVQTGVMHKVVDIPFEMTAELTVTPEGLIRIHPVEMKICNIDGQGLMKALGINLSKLLDLSKAKGASVQGNDILLDALKVLPPPALRGRLTEIRVQGDNVVQVFGTEQNPAAAPLQRAVSAPNYVFFRGGTIRFGKLFMVQSDLAAIDADPSDPFDFYLDYYETQLVAGYHTTERDYGLVAVMPDFNDLGTPKGHIVPPPAQ
jgi:hypothetical protein